MNAATRLAATFALVLAGTAELLPADAGMAMESNGVTCVALAIWTEARGEPIMGQVAVAEVIKARWESQRWSDDLCTVVMQDDQFHGIRDRATSGPPPWDVDREAWRLALQIADRVLLGMLKTPCAGATHFHAQDNNPGWSRRMEETCVIGDHVFLSEGQGAE